jgi:hypothetical protein
MKLEIDLTPAQVEQLASEAARLNVAPEQLARAIIGDLLSAPDAVFQAAAARVLARNAELYRRLA